MRLSVDDLLLIHRAAVSDLGQTVEEIGSHELAQLERILELADIAYPDDVLGLAADLAVQLTLHSLFPVGNYRTAVLAAAVIADHDGSKLSANWTELADLLLKLPGSSKGPGSMSGEVRAWLGQRGFVSGA